MLAQVWGRLEQKSLMLKNKCFDDLKLYAAIKNRDRHQAEPETTFEVLSDCYEKGQMAFGLILFLNPQ